MAAGCSNSRVQGAKQADCRAISEGLKRAESKLCVESGALEIIHYINNQKPWPWRLKSLGDDIRRISSNVNVISFVYIPREFKSPVPKYCQTQ